MIKIAIRAAKEAGKIIMQHYGNVKIKYKHKHYDAADIVSEADIKSERKIVEILKKNFPTHGIIAEEKHKSNEDADYIWHVDPLDGTSNFVRNIPLFGVSIGLTYKKKPVLGVLFFPVLKLLVYAEKNKGAFANNKRISVSNMELKKSLYHSGGYYRGKLQLEKPVADKVGLVKVIDASSYELAQIAMGDAELYILDNVPYDVVAGAIIVEEAGGVVSDEKGNKYTTDSKMIIVSNKKIHKEVIRLIKK